MITYLANKEDISVVITGEAGQGIDTATEIMMKIFKIAGYNVFSCKEYMSRVRGGVNSSEIRISSNKIAAYVDKIDILMVLTQNGISHLKGRITENTFIIYDAAFTNLDLAYFKHFSVPFASLSLSLGGKIYSNIISAGIFFGILRIENAVIEEYIEKLLSHKQKDVIQKNLEAVKIGYKIGINLLKENEFCIKQDESIKEKILISGNDAVALGCVAGGCDFIASYPMSPSTGVLTYLSENSNDFNIIAEQAEDEIAAINMALGAWYAGARAIVSTSGGGFALMTEAVSLAGMIESPIVIHLAQRPGPATGLPTRTEQGDLNLALYAGHGDFPRIIFAPGTPEEAFLLSQNAFNLADKYQVPVFILTDQHLIDSYFISKHFDVDSTEITEYITKTDKDYKRYKLVSDGISPRGIPSFGDGLIKIDSDEHDEDGHLTENLNLRISMVDKRLKKAELIKQDVYLPELTGSEDYKVLLIGWGATCNVIKEAINSINNPNIAFLYFKQVYPISENVLSYLKKADTVVCIENNATGQFSELICKETGYIIDNKILKYNGLPFSVEEIIEKVNNLIRENIL